MLEIPRTRTRDAACLAFTGLMLVLATPAHAGLGGNKDTIEADRGHIALRAHAVAITATGETHTLTLANDTVIREYVNAAGTIYAVAWQGPGKPDLRQVLGSHFAAFQEKSGPRAGRLNHRQPPQVADPALVVSTGGHPGSFWGVAFLPQIVPTGFDPNAL